MNDRNDQTALIYVNATLVSPRAQRHPGVQVAAFVCRSLFVGGWVMPHWFVPPIVIPAGLVALMVAIVLYRHLVGA
jgi:hypothetical protein